MSTTNIRTAIHNHLTQELNKFEQGCYPNHPAKDNDEFHDFLMRVHYPHLKEVNPITEKEFNGYWM